MFCLYNHVVEDNVLKKNTEINTHHFVYHEILAPKKPKDVLTWSPLNSNRT